VITKDLVRLAIAALIGLVAGIFFVVEGLDRSGGRGTVFVVLGAGIVASVVVLALAVLRTWSRQRGLSDEERAEARAARLEYAEQNRPAWLDSRGFAVLMLGISVYWTYLLVRALDRGAYGIAAVDAVFLLASATAVWRAFRRRRI